MELYFSLGKKPDLDFRTNMAAFLESRLLSSCFTNLIPPINDLISAFQVTERRETEEPPFTLCGIAAS